MSRRQLARYVNSLLEQGRVTVTETADGPLAVHGADLVCASELRALARAAGMDCSLVDCSDMAVTQEVLAAYCEPFHVMIQKPQLGYPLFLSDVGFVRWLEEEPEGVVCFAEAISSFETERFVMLVDDESVPNFETGELRKSPLSSVKCIGSCHLLPKDIRQYILRRQYIPNGDTDPPWGDRAFILWLQVAIPRLISSLASEVHSQSVKLEFYGPPRVLLENVSNGSPGALKTDGFWSLLAAVRWVYETDREVETRRKLFGIELARSAKNGGDAFSVFKDVAGSALEGAKIAHQFGLADISRDALKSMADLRKSVADETTRVAEAMRQLSLSVAGSLFYGLGLLAARMASTVNPLLLDCMAAVGFAYVSVIVWINHKHLGSQRDLRARWKGKFFEFLRQDDYRAMVTEPLEKAEGILTKAMCCALILAAVLFLSVVMHNHSKF